MHGSVVTLRLACPCPSMAALRSADVALQVRRCRPPGARPRPPYRPSPCVDLWSRKGVFSLKCDALRCVHNVISLTVLTCKVLLHRAPCWANSSVLSQDEPTSRRHRVSLRLRLPMRNLLPYSSGQCMANGWLDSGQHWHTFHHVSAE